VFNQFLYWDYVNIGVLTTNEIYNRKLRNTVIVGVCHIHKANNICIFTLQQCIISKQKLWQNADKYIMLQLQPFVYSQFSCDI